MLQVRDAPAEIKPQVEGNLLVPRPSSMKPFAKIANACGELPLDKRMHVLVRTVDEGRLTPPSLENVDQRGRHHFRLPTVEHADPGERLHPREASRDSVLEQAPVEAERGAKFKRSGIGVAAEAS